jgi:hypothetical protein
MLREITSGGTQTKNVEYHWSRISARVCHRQALCPARTMVSAVYQKQNPVNLNSDDETTNVTVS